MFNIWPWKSRSRSRSTTFVIAPFDGNYIIIWKAVWHFFWLTVSEILASEIFDPGKICQGHGVQLSQWQLSMSDVKICKNRFTNFCANSHHYPHINVWNVWPWNIGRGHEAIPSIAIIKIYENRMAHFELALTDSKYYHLK